MKVRDYANHIFENLGMFRMKQLTLLCLLAVIMLTGCEVMGPSVKVEPPKVKVKGVVVEGVQVQTGSTHCPPGQAKKGRC